VRPGITAVHAIPIQMFMQVRHSDGVKTMHTRFSFCESVSRGHRRYGAGANALSLRRLPNDQYSTRLYVNVTFGSRIQFALPSKWTTTFPALVRKEPSKSVSRRMVRKK